MSQDLLLGPGGGAERERERASERADKRVFHNLHSLRQNSGVGGGYRAIQGGEGGGGSGVEVSRAVLLGGDAQSRSIARWRGGDGGVEGTRGGGTSADLVTSIGEEVEEKEAFVFETASFQALQRRLEPLEVRAARVAAKKAVVAPGPP